jgi:hypothetical protein
MHRGSNRISHVLPSGLIIILALAVVSASLWLNRRHEIALNKDLDTLLQSADRQEAIAEYQEALRIWSDIKLGILELRRGSQK